MLVRKLQQGVLSGSNVERLRGALRRQIDQCRTISSKGSGGLSEQLAKRERDIDRAADNFLRAPAEVLDVVGKKLTGLKRQREHLQHELRQAESVTRPQDVDAEVETAVARLWRLGEDLGQAEPARRREVFRLLVDRIELRFDRLPTGKRTECPLRSGELYLQTGAGTIFGSASRGDRI